MASLVDVDCGAIDVDLIILFTEAMTRAVLGDGHISSVLDCGRFYSILITNLVNAYSNSAFILTDLIKRGPIALTILTDGHAGTPSSIRLINSSRIAATELDHLHGSIPERPVEDRFVIIANLLLEDFSVVVCIGVIAAVRSSITYIGLIIKAVLELLDRTLFSIAVTLIEIHNGLIAGRFSV
ncbi:hypothetical protein CKO13_01610 [Halorhodospira neutriphila]|uniref:Uncharacterized protein n=1 Tax=Halorhodospira neutriphila TaxID=168379 RepID=A0ABS1E3P6_9GAMM|nr:hypothetical protein [Halorhodospira neutriphila]